MLQMSPMRCPHPCVCAWAASVAEQRLALRTCAKQLVSSCTHAHTCIAGVRPVCLTPWHALVPCAT